MLVAHSVSVENCLKLHVYIFIYISVKCKKNVTNNIIMDWMRFCSFCICKHTKWKKKTIIWKKAMEKKINFEENDYYRYRHIQIFQITKTDRFFPFDWHLSRCLLQFGTFTWIFHQIHLPIFHCNKNRRPFLLWKNGKSGNKRGKLHCVYFRLQRFSYGPKNKSSTMMLENAWERQAAKNSLHWWNQKKKVEKIHQFYI